MPSPKQVRAHYKRIRYRWSQLQKALQAAHDAEVIVYDDKKENSYQELAPCWASYELKKRIEKTTEATRAKAFRDECEMQMGYSVW